MRLTRFVHYSNTPAGIALHRTNLVRRSFGYYGNTRNSLGPVCFRAAHARSKWSARHAALDATGTGRHEVTKSHPRNAPATTRIGRHQRSLMLSTAAEGDDLPGNLPRPTRELLKDLLTPRPPQMRFYRTPVLQFRALLIFGRREFAAENSGTVFAIRRSTVEIAWKRRVPGYVEIAMHGETVLTAYRWYHTDADRGPG